MTDTSKNKRKKSRTFMITSIIIGIITFLIFIFFLIDTVLTVLSFKGLGNYLNTPSNNTGSAQVNVNPEPAGDKVWFHEDMISLGDRGDGYFYAIVRMSGADPSTYNEEEYVVLKKYAEVPVVTYFVNQRGTETAYLIEENLEEDDFSDLIDENITVSYPEIFDNKTDMTFRVIEMDDDILKTPEDYMNERSDRTNSGIEGLFKILGTYVGLSALGIFGVILSIVSGIAFLILFIVFLVFLILAVVHSVRENKHVQA